MLANDRIHSLILAILHEVVKTIISRKLSQNENTNILLHCINEWMWKFHGFNFITRYVKDLQNPSVMLEHTTLYCEVCQSWAASSRSRLQLVRWCSWEGAVINQQVESQTMVTLLPNWRQPQSATNKAEAKSLQWKGGEACPTRPPQQCHCIKPVTCDASKWSSMRGKNWSAGQPKTDGAWPTGHLLLATPV